MAYMALIKLLPHLDGKEKKKNVAVSKHTAANIYERSVAIKRRRNK